MLIITLPDFSKYTAVITILCQFFYFCITAAYKQRSVRSVPTVLSFCYIDYVMQFLTVSCCVNCAFIAKNH